MRAMALVLLGAIGAGCAKEEFAKVKAPLPTSTTTNYSTQKNMRAIRKWRTLKSGYRPDRIIFVDKSQLMCIGEKLTKEGVFVRGWLQWWNVRSGERIREKIFNKFPASSLAMAPDGKTCATAHANYVKLWDVKSGRNIKTMSTTATEVAFSPNGKLLATAGEPVDENGEPADKSRRTGAKEIIKVWSVPGFTLQSSLHKTMAPHSYYNVSSLNFMPDGKRVVAATNAGQMLLWNVQTSQASESPSGYKIILSPDGRRAFVESTYVVTSDFTVPSTGLFDTKTWQRQDGLTSKWQKFDQPLSAWANGVAFSPDSKTVAAAFGDTFFGLFDAQTGKLLRELRLSQPSHFYPLAFSPDGNILAAGNWSQIEILQLK